MRSPPPVCFQGRRGELGVGDDVSEPLSPVWLGARDSLSVTDPARRSAAAAASSRRFGVRRSAPDSLQGPGADDDVVGLGADNVARDRIELQIDRGDRGPELVAAGDEPSIDLAD